jgi:hypothetical protein
MHKVQKRIILCQYTNEIAAHLGVGMIALSVL